MGYTQYWKHKELQQNIWDTIVLPTVKKVYQEYSNLIDTSEHSLILDSNQIKLNGILENAYEDFILSKEECEFGFCKTAGKPYDLVICIILITLSKKIKHFRFSSDGINDKEVDHEWIIAIEQYNRIFNDKITQKNLIKLVLK